MIRTLLLGVTLTLCACSSHHHVIHQGLAKDGYGFTNDSGSLPPPENLMHTQKRP